MAKQEIYEIEDLQVLEISEVDVPAIGETFYFVKRGANMDEILARFDELEKSLGKEMVDKIKSALKVLKPIYDEAPADVKEAIEILAESVGYPAPKEDKYPEPVKKSEETSEIESTDEVVKRLEKKIETVEKLIQRLVEEFEKLKADYDKEVKEKEVKKYADLEQRIDSLLDTMKARVEEKNSIIVGLRKLLKEE